jgi:putative transcriptional regulator
MNNEIKHHREQLGLSASALGLLIGWSQQRVSAYEVGARTPGLIECRLIVAALNKKKGRGRLSLADVFPE